MNDDFYNSHDFHNNPFSSAWTRGWLDNELHRNAEDNAFEQGLEHQNEEADKGLAGDIRADDYMKEQKLAQDEKDVKSDYAKDIAWNRRHGF